MYLNWTNMYSLGFNGLIECRLQNIFESGLCDNLTYYIYTVFESSDS